MPQESLSECSLSEDRVYIHNSPVFEDEKWQVFQKRERAHWQALDESGFKPDLKRDFETCFHRWGIAYNHFASKNVLEIGSGAFGFFSIFNEMKDMVFPELAIASDPLMDFYQSLKLSRKMPEKVLRLKAPGEDLPFVDASLDVVVTMNTIDHVSDCHAMLREIHRVLKPGGEILFSVHTIVSLVSYFSFIVEAIDKNHPYHFIDKDVEDMFNINGFKIIKKDPRMLYTEVDCPENIGFSKKCLFYLAFRLMKLYFGRAIKV